MKLLTKTNIYTSLVTVVMFAIGVFVTYKLIVLRLDKEVDTQLILAKSSIEKGLKAGIKPYEFTANIGQKIYVRKIPKQTQFNNRFIEYVDRSFKENLGKGKITQRELLFHTTINHQAYEVTVCASLTESEKMGEYISYVVLVFMITAFILLFFFNQYISSVIWFPFNDTLSKIKTWNIKKNKKLKFKDTDIDEFHLLNDTLTDLTTQIQTDYYKLKEFTENVSHEAQTPLAIISTKIELLMQQQNYTEKQYEMLSQAYKATQRIYKLNQALILLTRIENKQFSDSKETKLNEAIDEKIEILEDFIEAKQITIIKEYNADVTIDVNAILLPILLNNLFINAIKYNLDEGGFIKVIVDENSFSVENSSRFDKIDRQFIFERFNKSEESGSLGVGLSLVKKIVDFYNWQITYVCKDSVHKFKIFM